MILPAALVGSLAFLVGIWGHLSLAHEDELTFAVVSDSGKAPRRLSSLLESV